MELIPKGNEQHTSHIPALVTLMNLGSTFLPTTECQALRGSQREVVLKPVLERVLRRRRFELKGEWYPLSDQAVDQVVNRAVAENSLNPVGIEQDVRKNLLPRLFALVGLDKAKEVLNEVVQILRNGLANR